MSKKNKQNPVFPAKQTVELDRILAQAGALHGQNRFPEAIALYRQALTLRYAFPELHCNLGIAYYQMGSIQDAIACFREAAKLAPRLARAHFFLGTALSSQGDYRQAVDALRKAVDINPKDPQALANLGISLNGMGRADEAISMLARAIEISPTVAKLHLDYGLALGRKRRYKEAIAAFRQSIALDPLNADTHSNLGSALQELSHSHTHESIACYEEAIRLNPSLSVAHANLGTIYERHGEPEKAAGYFDRAVALVPTPTNLSQSLFNRNYCGSMSAELVAAEHFKAGAILEQQAAAGRLPPRPRVQKARLRVGFVSPDLRNHAISFFLKPLLRNRDHARVEIFCYADVAVPDFVSEQLQGLSDHWLDTIGLSDDELAARIRSDEIDILIDLAGHCPINRLPTFARRPAPLQMTWLGYPNTSGLTTIDYRIVDDVTDPPGAADALASETLLRLPNGFLCYEPQAKAPAPAMTDQAVDGAITFGSFNNPSKMTAPTFDAWSKLLHRLPTARLLLKSNRLEIMPLRDHLVVNFADRGIAADRLIFLSGDPDPQDHLARYHHVDVALDPLLYNGTTTTCDALWMGVPVVTMRGDRHAACVGASLLTQIDLPELIADDPDDYVEIAARLAQDRPKLAEWRQTLRPRMAASSLCDGPAFARKFEAALFQVWQATDKIVTTAPAVPTVLPASVAAAAPAKARSATPLPVPAPTAGQTPTSGDIAAALKILAESLARHTAGPGRATLQALRDGRNQLVLALLAGPPMPTFEPAQFADINAGLGYAGLKTSVEDQQERLLLAQARDQISADDDRLATSLLAHCLLQSAHTLPVLPPLQQIPLAWMGLVLTALYEEPIFWSAQNEPARHLVFVEALTRQCADLVEALPVEQRSSDLALMFANAGRFTGAYFADKSLKSLARDRARLAERCLKLLGLPLDYQFARSSRKRLRLGCYRIHWLANTEVAAILAHLRGLDDRFEIILYSNHPLGDTPCEKAARALAHEIRVLPDNLPGLLTAIRADDLDIFLLGHNITAVASIPTFLHACRLARFQVATTLCPSTTGLGTMDAFLNGAFNERAAAQDDYTEKLLLAPGAINLYDYHDDSVTDMPLFNRAQLGVPDQSFLFVSGANAHKITTELLKSWAYILERTENSTLLLYPFNPHWRDNYPRLEFERHVRKIMSLADIDPLRIILLPPQPDRAHIRSILRLADLYLDSFPFSGAVSILDPIEAQLPMLLFQGDQARCRQSVGMHRGFALPASVAHFVGEYENMAIALASQPDKLAALKADCIPCLSRIQAGRLQIADLLYQSFAIHEGAREIGKREA